MIPTVEDVRSSPLVHRYGDIFNPPGLTNRIGCVQAEFDLTAIRSLNFPPFGAGDAATAGLFVDGRYFPSTGAPITFTWFPDRIERTAEWNGLAFRSVTALVVGERAAIVHLEIRNDSGVERAVDVAFGIRTAVTRSDKPWLASVPPATSGHDVDIDPATKTVLFTAPDGSACSSQGALPIPDEVAPDHLRWRVQLAPGARAEFHYANAYAPSGDEARALVLRVLHALPQELERARTDWNDELRAVFTPGNDRYGGSLPVLETSDEDIRRAWLSGILGVVYFRRESPTFGSSYDTLMPRYWQTVTFLWDYSLSSLVHGMLDPQTMRRHLEHWMITDVHSCFGTEWLTGGPVGGWYSVNDYAMNKMIGDYLRWTGDMSWLDREAGGVAVAARIDEYAQNWRQFRTSSGLADYGGIDNLLECVSSYVHEVAALNASNVWSLRFAADIAEMRGDAARARSFREEASVLAATVQQLYADGEGFWHARHPDGRMVPTRHCYDFITTLTTIDADLSDKQREEMTAFFERELQTPLWMHALSPADPDAIFSVRPDHQWNGAYPAWPPLAVNGLFRIGKHDLAVEWLRGLGKSGNQGPYGQAHFIDTVVEPDAGGARKAPSDFPYINDWACSSGGAWPAAIIEGLFGVDAKMNGITATPRFGPFDPDARLRNLPHQGKLYDVDRGGIHEVKQ